MTRSRFPLFATLIEILSPRARRRASLRNSWGRAGDEDGWLASRYFDLQRERHCVDDKTWTDLELPGLFRQMDTTVTGVGRQYLYRLMRTYDFDVDALARRYTAYHVLGTEAPLREQLQLALTGLESDSAAYIADALFGAPPFILNRSHLLYTWALCCLISIVAVAHFGLWPLAVTLTVNATVLYKLSPRLRRDTETLINARRLLAVADRLGSVGPHSAIPQLAELQAQRRKRARLRRDLRWLALSADEKSPLAGIWLAADWLCLARVVAYDRAARRFTRSRKEWASTFEIVGYLDAAIAVANFLQRVPIHCQPSVSDEATLAIADGYHPLIAHPTVNSLTLEHRSALVTGSNLAGKTTFVKMVAINLILGHTLGICLASSATLPRSGVMALIRGDQSVVSGKSHYAAEAAAIGEFVQRASTGECRIFIIDEPFSGTNTIERIAVVKAVLDAMSAHAQVLATTHDVELQHMLRERFDFFYFREDPEVEGFFDFKVRTGVSTERNAIRVLQRMGFPPEIVSTALSLVGKPPVP